MTQVIPADVVSRSGELIASPLAYAASGSPLMHLEPRERAAILLLQAGESPALVGHRILRARVRYATRASLELLERAMVDLLIVATRPPAAAVARLERAVPDATMRWGFVLRAAGLLSETEIARLLGVHRATVYRHLDGATGRLRAAAPAAAPRRAEASSALERSGAAGSRSA